MKNLTLILCLSITLSNADDLLGNYSRVFQNDAGFHPAAIPNNMERWADGSLHKIYNAPLQLNSPSQQYLIRERPNSRNALKANEYCARYACTQ